MWEDCREEIFFKQNMNNIVAIDFVELVVFDFMSKEAVDLLANIPWEFNE